MICLLVASKASFEPTENVLAEFQEFTIRYTGGKHVDRSFRYRLHTPTIVDQSKRYPILIWLHGGKERGTDNRAQLRWLDMVLEELPTDRVDYFILAAQVPSGVRHWTSGEVEADEMLTVIKGIFDDVAAKWPIDTSRVYLAGVSSGGSGCWEMAIRYPNLFAGVAPMGSGGADLTRLAGIKSIPIWAFHSEADHPDAVQRTVETLRSLDGAVYFTLIRSDPHDLSDWLHKHDCWREAIQKYGAIDWLFLQRFGSPVVPPSGHEPWNWIQYSTGVFVLIGFCGVSWFVVHRLRM